MAHVPVFRATVAGLLASAVFAILYRAPVRAAQHELLTIYNDTNVAITQLYDRKSGETFWGINDLATGAVKPGHSFYIRMAQNTYEHCPEFYRDVKLVFANGVTRVLSHVSVCNIDVHIHKP